MAATERPLTCGKIVMAALALHAAVAPAAARAETAPEQGVIALRYLQYKDQQDVEVPYPGYTGTEGRTFKRITVKSPSVYLMTPVGSGWTVEASAVTDTVSGATPRSYSDVSSATPAPGMNDYRKAGDVRISRHFSRGGVSVAASHSEEHDYRSSALSVEGRVATSDHNTTLTLGLAHAEDRINPVNQLVIDEARRTNEVIVGVTQALTATDLLQLNVTWADGEGYFSDPYKRNDRRPDHRSQGAALVRWNHFVAAVDATVRLGYRYCRDSFGIAAHTLDAAWVQPVTPWLWLTPSARYHTQRAAEFYVDPVLDAADYPRPATSLLYATTDPRLSAFGGITAGLKAEVRWADWTGDVKYERYEQRSSWRGLGTGSPNVDNFQADSVQVGISKKF